MGHKWNDPDPTNMNDKKKEALIQLVKERPAIWDKSSKDHLNRDLISVNWSSIRDSLSKMFPEEDFTVAAIKKAWQILRTQYRDKIREFKGSLRGGIVDGEIVFPKWVYFKQLTFLNGGLNNLIASISHLNQMAFSYHSGVSRVSDDSQEPVGSIDSFYTVEEDDGDEIVVRENDPLHGSEMHSSQKHSNVTITSTESMASASPNASNSSLNNNLEPNGPRKRRNISENTPFEDTRNVNEALKATVALLNKEDDDDETKFAIYLASLLRKLPNEQKLSVQKDILKLVFDKVT